MTPDLRALLGPDAGSLLGCACQLLALIPEKQLLAGLELAGRGAERGLIEAAIDLRRACEEVSR